jgi:hypothetical protein
MKEPAFDSTPEFQHFKEVMRGVLAVPKKRLDALVQASKNESPRIGNPSAPGRKRTKKRKVLVSSDKRPLNSITKTAIMAIANKPQTARS